MSFRAALLRIFFTTLFISGTAWLTWFIYSHISKSRSLDNNYQLIAVVQTGLQKEAIKTNFLNEILGLSIDHPTNTYRFNLLEGEKKLMTFPLIKKAVIKRIPPSTLYIDYTIRTPIAFIGDLSNTVIDEEGIIFPFHPFFTPKNLPKVYLGVSEKDSLTWGKSLLPLTKKILDELFAINHILFKNQVTVREIDISRIESPSFGERQIILTINENSNEELKKSFKRILILNPDFYLNGINRYLLVKNSKIFNDEVNIIFDLRLPNLAYVKKIND